MGRKGLLASALGITAAMEQQHSRLLRATAGVFAGALLAIASFATPADAATYEGVLYEHEGDLLWCTGGTNGNAPCAGAVLVGSASAADQYARDWNAQLEIAPGVLAFPGGVDIIGKYENGSFTRDSSLAAHIDLAVDVTFDSPEWSWELTGASVDIWSVVKIGVKQGNWTAYFLVDPYDGADLGSFTMEYLIGQAGGALDVWLNNQGVAPTGLSHITFFGTTVNGDQPVPEPGSLALLGLGLAGLAWTGRRRRR